MNEPKVMTLPEVAALLRVHYSTAHRLVHRGKIPGAFKLGSDWRFNREQIEQWLREVDHK